MQTHINNLLTTLNNSHREINQKVLADIGLPSGQAQILSVLWSRDGLSQADISKELGISAPTVSSLISKLESSKFLKCKKCKSDKRLVRVYLTKKGFDIRSEAEAKWRQIEEIILTDFSDTEKIMVMMLLEKIKNNLQTDISDIIKD